MKLWRFTFEKYLVSYNGDRGWLLRLNPLSFQTWGYGRARLVLHSEQLRCLLIDPSEKLEFRNANYCQKAGLHHLDVYSHGKKVGGTWEDYLLNPFVRAWFFVRRWSVLATAIMIAGTVLLAGM